MNKDDYESLNLKVITNIGEDLQKALVASSSAFLTGHKAFQVFQRAVEKAKWKDELDKFYLEARPLTLEDLNVVIPSTQPKQVEIRENGLKHLRAKQMKRSRK